MKNIIKLFIFPIIFFLIVLFNDIFKIINNEKSITINNISDINNEKINKELFANEKNILIILDNFDKPNYHGINVSDKLYIYFKNYLKKEVDIKIINLSFNNNSGNLQNLKLINYNGEKIEKYKKVSNNEYSLETYLKQIKKINPNSKIVLSLSVFNYKIYQDIIKLSIKYNFNIGYAYFNNFIINNNYNPINICRSLYLFIYFNIFLDTKTNIKIIAREDYKPLFKNYLTINYLNKSIVDQYIKNLPTSYLTPILTYEYYFNNSINHK